MNNKIKINALDLLVVVEAPLRVHLHQLTPCDSQLLLRPPHIISLHVIFTNRNHHETETNAILQLKKINKQLSLLH